MNRFKSPTSPLSPLNPPLSPTINENFWRDLCFEGYYSYEKWKVGQVNDTHILEVPNRAPITTIKLFNIVADNITCECILVGDDLGNIALYKNDLCKKVNNWHGYQILRGHYDSISDLNLEIQKGLLASSSFDSTICLWKLDNSAKLEKKMVLEGHLDWVRTVKFCTLDHKKLISCSRDKTIRIWDIEKGMLLHTFGGESITFCLEDVSSLFASPTFISGGSDGTLALWDIRFKKCIFSKRVHTDLIKTIKLHQNSFITSSFDTTLKIFDTKNFEKPLFDIKAHKSPINDIDVEGDKVASVGRDGSLRSWNLKNGECFTQYVTPQLMRRAMRLQNDQFTEMNRNCTVRMIHGRIYSNNDYPNSIVYWNQECVVPITSFQPTRDEVYINCFEVDSRKLVASVVSRRPYMHIWSFNPSKL